MRAAGIVALVFTGIVVFSVVLSLGAMWLARGIGELGLLPW